MSYKAFFKNQMLVRVGTVSEVTVYPRCSEPEVIMKTEQGRVFVVLHGTRKIIKAQIDVIAQLNQIMNNTSIKRA